MNRDLHERAKAAFAGAVGLAGSERARFIEAACDGDLDLRAEVHSLLAFHHEATGPTQATDSPRLGGPRLEPGTLYAGRYRVVEWLGEGGMGEVYRADDTLLDVRVALKRVLRHPYADPKRVLSEVRLAREITHPAVCRMFDAGQTDEAFYFTMEYVDGENLAALLRRIGRLPSAKVLDIARQLTAGLAAAHARGVLHRDLKPANVMIDGRGDIRITDFGIAIEADAANTGRAIVGTPAYMAPELLRGEPASPQSDLYALGLVLYELVTGEHAYGGQMPDPLAGARPRPTPASALVPDIHPDLDAAIVGALADRPADRHASALALAGALPGGDVLRIALEAGQTPPPELVAAAGPEGRLTRGAAAGLVAIVVAGWAIVVVSAGAGLRLIDRVPLTDPPVVQAAAARGLLRELLGDTTGMPGVFRLQGHSAYLAHLAADRTAPVDPSELAEFVYREGPEQPGAGLRLGAGDPSEISLHSPPMIVPGTRGDVFHGRRQHRAFPAVPVPSRNARSRDIDWTPLVRASGVEPSALTPVAPGAGPMPFGDRRFAWEAPLSGSGDVVRIEAAAAGGSPTAFDVVPRWPGTPETAASSSNVLPAMAAALVVFLGALGLARRNLRLNRGDPRGAGRLTLGLFLTLLISFSLSTWWLPFETSVRQLLEAAAGALMRAAIAGVFYVALEPVVRRRWPASLVAWSRVLAGRWHDPLVGRDILIGAAIAVASAGAYGALELAGAAPTGDRPAALPLSVFQGTRHLLSVLARFAADAVQGGLVLTFLFTLFVLVLRRTWLAAAAVLAVFAVLSATGAVSTPGELAIGVLVQAIIVAGFVRFGLVALMSCLFFFQAATSLPLAAYQDWRAEITLLTWLVLGLVVGLASRAAMRESRTNTRRA